MIKIVNQPLTSNLTGIYISEIDMHGKNVSGWFDTFNNTAETGHILHFSSGASGPDVSHFTFFITGAVRNHHATCGDGTRYRQILGYPYGLDQGDGVIDELTNDQKVSVTINRVGGAGTELFAGASVNYS